MRLEKSMAWCVSSVLTLAVAVSAGRVSAASDTVTVPNKGQGKITIKGIQASGTSTNQGNTSKVISRPHTTQKTVIANVAIPFQTIRRETDMLYVGQQHVLAYGVEGVLRRTTTLLYVNGHKVGRRVSERVVRPERSEVVLVGTKIRPRAAVRNTLSGRSESGYDVIKELTVVATAYVAGGVTATGVPAEPGVIAVDPSFIPLGTKLYIPGIGVVRAQDTGGAITGDRIDICMSSYTAADDWGVRTIQVYEIS